jgi:peptidoglycan/xylan/chitin deacetylase (PgdA/CDA1 family)
MFIEQPPFFYRALFPGVIWRIPAKKKCVYLTFDDGPIPEVTPWVLDTLDKYGIKATFFCVGDNVRKYPEVYQMVLDRGHKVLATTPSTIFRVSDSGQRIMWPM